MSVVELRVTVLDAAFDPHASMWGDATAGWLPPAMTWLCTLSAAGVPVVGCDTPPDGVDGLLVVPDPDAWPDVATDRRRRVLTGPPPDGAAATLACVRDALGALVTPDLRGVLVLRLDDPGAAVRRYLRSWRHDDVPAAAWSALWKAVATIGRMSVFCCPGWVGSDGTVVPSRRANPDEWAALDAGVQQGVADLECHGYTHIHPDKTSWVRSTDRFDETGWYQELAPAIPAGAAEPPVDAQRAILDAWASECGVATTLVAPGEAWGLNTIAAARASQLQLFNSWSICRLQAQVPTWSAGIGSPYLDEPDECWLVDGLPAVGYWHDRDMAVNGPDWVATQLDRWRDCGMAKTWAFADLARAYDTDVEAHLIDGEVIVASAPAGTPLRVELAR